MTIHDFRNKFILHLKDCNITVNDKIVTSQLIQKLKDIFPNVLISNRKIFLTFHKNTDITSLKSLTQKVLLIPKNWFDAWSSKDMLCVPSSIRYQLLDLGSQHELSIE